jgi:5-methylcytosine-specific restriction endonuclease McrA
MPYQRNGVRNYKLENLLYNSRPKQRKQRSKRTIARNNAIAEGRVKRGDGMDLDHIKPLSKGGSNSQGNIRVTTPAANRSFARNADGSLKSQRSKRERKR